MEKTHAASHMVVGAGQHIKKAYNLKGEPLGRRNRDGPTEVGAQFGCTNAKGEWVVTKTRDNPDKKLTYPRNDYDWFYQSFCSAHMEEAHQWGPGIGFENDLFMTNEEWHEYDPTNTFVGCTYHALDLEHDTLYAVGALSAGGFEKSAEINPQNPDYVMIALSGAIRIYYICQFVLLIILLMAISSFGYRLQWRLCGYGRNTRSPQRALRPDPS